MISNDKIGASEGLEPPTPWSEHALDRANRSAKMLGSNKGLWPRFGLFLPRGLALILGFIPRLKIIFRLARQS
jgi:hypothetical protein